MLKKIILILSLLVSVSFLQNCQTTSPFVTGAKIALQSGNTKKAANELNKALKANPKDAEAAYLMGTVYSEEENYTKMKEYYDMALSLNPTANKKSIVDDTKRVFSLVLARGVNQEFNKAAKLSVKDPKKSKELFAKARKSLELAHLLKDDDFTCINVLASVYIQLGDKSKAKESYLKSLKLVDVKKDKKKIIPTYQNLAVLFLEEGNKEESINYYKKILEIDGKNKDAIVKMADYYAEKEQVDEAMKMYDKILDIEPDNVVILFNKGITFRKLKNYEKAVEVFKKIIELDPKDNEVKVILAGTYYNMEKWQEIVNLLVEPFESFTSKEQNDCRNYLVQALVKLGRNKEANSFFKE